MSNWSQLEEYVKQITSNDNTKRTPRSGATKKEEDVVGESLVCQCKDTDDKNFSILAKDLNRLTSAADLQNKFPLFFSRNESCVLLTIPMTYDEHKEMACMVINYIILRKRLQLLRQVDPRDFKDLAAAEKEHAKLRKILAFLSRESIEHLDSIEKKLDTKRDDLLTHDLFEEHIDEPQNR